MTWMLFRRGLMAGAVFAALAGCGGKVVVPPSGSTGGTGGEGGTSCTGDAPSCVQLCGSTIFLPNGECVGGQWVCKEGVDISTCPVTVCCSSWTQCGDAQFVPCVEGVCKAGVEGGCWADQQCDPGSVCVGAVVCPCAADCDEEDQPGKCIALP